MPAVAPRRRSICAAPGSRELAFRSEPQGGEIGAGVAAASAEVAVEGDHGGVADCDGAGSGLAGDPSDAPRVVDVLDVHVDELAEAHTGVGEHQHDGGVAPIGEAAALARVEQIVHLIGAENRWWVVGHLGVGHPGEGVAVDLFFRVQPSEQGAEVPVVHAEGR